MNATMLLFLAAVTAFVVYEVEKDRKGGSVAGSSVAGCGCGGSPPDDVIVYDESFYYNGRVDPSIRVRGR